MTATVTPPAAPGGIRSLASWQRAAGPVLLAFLLTRAMLALVIFLSSSMMPVRPGPYLFASPGNLVVDGLVRYDSWWYRDIVRNGYRAGSLATGEQGTTAFFPLYPLLVKGATFVTGNVFVAGILVSNLCFLAALFALWFWARLDNGEDSANRAVFYLAAAPTALFFSAMYTESLFILLVAATFLFARRGNFWLAAIPGILAAATRNTGVLMAAVIAAEALQQAGVRLRPPDWRPAAAIRFLASQVGVALRAWRSWLPALLVPLGLIAYMAYLKLHFGDPLAFIHAQATWGRSTSPGGILHLLPHTIEELRIERFWAGRVNGVTLMDVLATLAFLPVVVAVALKTRASYAIYCVLTFLIPLATGSVGSMTRYV
ncbi:MAG: hypothetical protein ACR2J8_09665, partial [Thermomicrobiales bacterium]